MHVCRPVALSACLLLLLAACGDRGGSAVVGPGPVEPSAGVSLPLPSGHGLAAGEISVAPGSSDEHGNVVVSCPVGGLACVLIVAADGTAEYERTGGMPSVMVASESLATPYVHGLPTGSITVQPGTSEEHDNVILSCPSDGQACVMTVSTDGMVTFSRTGGTPTYMLIPPEEFPDLPQSETVHAAQAPTIDYQETLHVGADVAPPAELLTAGHSYGAIATSSGWVQDGTDAARVIEFLGQHIGVSTSEAGSGYTFTRTTTGLPTFVDPPTVRLAAGTSDEFAHYAIRAVQLINGALPYEQRIAFSSIPAPALTAIGNIPDGEIYIDFAASSDDWNLANRNFRPGSAAVAENDPIAEWDAAQSRWEDKEMRAAHVWFDLERLQNAAWVLNPATGQHEEVLLNMPVTDPTIRVYSEEDIFAIVAHELVHVLGFLAHNDGARFPDSIMRGTTLLTISTLPTIDSDALFAAYDRLQPGTEPEDLSVQSLGQWTDTSFHIRGSFEFPGGEAAYGVASRNGRAQPWASGPTPWMELPDNQELSGNVTWSGALLGITPNGETVSGSASLAISLSTLDGNLDFDGLESWGTNAPPGTMGQGTLWGDGDLAYTIEVQGNSFWQTGGDDGEVTGTFLGATHEAMGGVLERSDVAAGFGGKR